MKHISPFVMDSPFPVEERNTFRGDRVTADTTENGLYPLEVQEIGHCHRTPILESHPYVSGKLIVNVN